MKEAALRSLQNERFVAGESVFKFEEEFARYIGTDFAAATASGTSALTLSLIALGVRGHEAVTTPASFIASANAIIHAGAEPKFADISQETYTIDPVKVRASLTERTKAVIPVHLYGFPAAMNEICEIASQRGLSVVEDACQAHGASYRGKRLGSIGDVGCFSFYPAKNMTVAGDGGMVVTNEESIIEQVKSLRDCGRMKGAKYAHDLIGFTERLSTVQAAIGRVQLRRLDKWNESRRLIAQKYDALLSDLNEVVTPPHPDTVSSPVYHLYVIRCQRRDELRAWLDKVGIETGIHYPDPIHLQPVYRRMFGYRGGEFPNSEALCRDALSIPMYPTMAASEVELVSDSIHDFYRSKKSP